MANIKSAKKQAIQNEKRRQINLARKTSVKTAVKKVLTAIEKNAPVEQAKELLKDAEAKLARAKNKGVLHFNTVRRKISNLAQKIAEYTKEQQASK
ncbi:MAG: 30S ribosomal protein S20 [Candidatus Babeliales bacterium]